MADSFIFFGFLIIPAIWLGFLGSTNILLVTFLKTLPYILSIVYGSFIMILVIDLWLDLDLDPDSLSLDLNP